MNELKPGQKYHIETIKASYTSVELVSVDKAGNLTVKVTKGKDPNNGKFWIGSIRFDTDIERIKKDELLSIREIM